MPQIGWLEILSIIIIAILVLGPKEFPVVLKKIGSYVGKFKSTLSNFQKEVSNVTEDINLEEKTVTKKDDKQKKMNENE
tara:strand:- start:757 stop:993 length:237 start_codon:yes stop_codon:yes gene_type:complete